MSALCGVYRVDGGPADPDACGVMMAALSHRGPEGSGTWSRGPVALGHQMLHSTPQSLHETLPLVRADRSLAITIDARIDNREELSRALSVPLSARETMPDSELVLKAYEAWDTGCAERLLGDFAFAVWDGPRQRLYCARDHMGARPLYYRWHDRTFAFASEVRALMSLPGVSWDLNDDVIAEFLLAWPFDNSVTFFREVEQVRPAHWLTVAPEGVRARQYWDPHPLPTTRLKRDEEYAEALRERVERAVRSRMRTVFPVAVQLSGGLDSSAVACIAARELRRQGKRLFAVSSVLPPGHPGPESDERQYIQAVVAQEDNIDLVPVCAEGATPLDNLAALSAHYHAPVTDPFYYMEHALLQAAAARGARTVLSGYGGDMAASYNAREALVQLVWGGHWVRLARLVPPCAGVQEVPRLRLLRRAATYPVRPALHVLRRAFGGTSRSRGDLPTAAGVVFARTATFRAARRRMRRSFADTMRVSDGIRRGVSVESDLANALAYEDATGGRYRLHPCMPLVDKTIVELVLTVSPEGFLAGGWPRGLFLKAMAGILPPEVLWRRSKGVFTPDYHARVLSARDTIRSLVDSVSQDQHVNRYISTAAITRQLELVSVCASRDAWETATQAIVGRGCALAAFLQWAGSREAGKNVLAGVIPQHL
jgi:asparagine synthase (glutamine-hydrolysing)